MQGLESTDLNATAASLPPGGSIAAHTNNEVDVAVIIISGQGMLMVNSQQIPLQSGSLILIPKGQQRSLTAGEDGLSYVNVHRRRQKLMPGIMSARPK